VVGIVNTNKSFGSLKDDIFLDQPGNCQILKEDSVP
jgi:hypothetical protein